MQTTVFREKTRLEKIWRQVSVPVCFRRGKGQTLLVRLPYAADNLAWLMAADGPPKTPLVSATQGVLGPAGQLVR